MSIDEMVPSVKPTVTGRTSTVLSGLDHVDERPLRAALRGRCRNNDGILLCIQKEARVHELVWPKHTVLVTKDRFEAIGPRGLVDLIVDGEQSPRR